MSTEVEYDLFLAVTERLLSKRQRRTPEESALFVLLVKLIEDYEAEHYPLRSSGEIMPHKFLQHMMEAREMEPENLIDLLHVSSGLAQAIFNGEQQIDRTQAQLLSDHFHVDTNNFYS